MRWQKEMNVNEVDGKKKEGKTLARERNIRFQSADVKDNKVLVIALTFACRIPILLCAPKIQTSSIITTPGM